MQTRLYINNELCQDLKHLQVLMKKIPVDSEVYSDILEYSRYGDLSSWLREHDNSELADQVDEIDKKVGDTEYITALSQILLGEKAIIKKPHYSGCFSCEITTTIQNAKEVVILLSLTIAVPINENYEIKVVSGWGTKARLFNPSLYEGNVVENVQITFHKRSDKKLDKVVVTIDNEQIFEEHISIPNIEISSTVKNNHREDDDLRTIPESSEVLQQVVGFVSLLERSNLLNMSNKKNTTINTVQQLQNKAKTEYIRTLAGDVPKEEWLKRREEERKAAMEARHRKEEEAEREAMAERWRRKHGS